jgi:hypothetical protein
VAVARAGGAGGGDVAVSKAGRWMEVVVTWPS